MGEEMYNRGRGTKGGACGEDFVPQTTLTTGVCGGMPV